MASPRSRKSQSLPVSLIPQFIYQRRDIDLFFSNSNSHANQVHCLHDDSSDRHPHTVSYHHQDFHPDSLGNCLCSKGWTYVLDEWKEQVETISGHFVMLFSVTSISLPFLSGGALVWVEDPKTHELMKMLHCATFLYPSRKNKTNMFVTSVPKFLYISLLSRGSVVVELSSCSTSKKPKTRTSFT